MITDNVLLVSTQLTTASLSAPTPTPAPTVLKTTDTVVGIVGTSLSALALLIGGGWAYFKFVRGRTFRKRADVTIAGGWAEVENEKRLHVLVTVKNTSGVKLEPMQKGTGLAINTMLVNDHGRVTWVSGIVTPSLKITPDWNRVTPSATTEFHRLRSHSPGSPFKRMCASCGNAGGRTQRSR